MRTEGTVNLGKDSDAGKLLGQREEFVRLVQDRIGIEVVVRDNTLTLFGSDKEVAAGVEVFSRMQEILKNHGYLKRHDVEDAITAAGETSEAAEFARIETSPGGKCVIPKTQGQNEYTQAIRSNDLVFAIGPAGSGKTYLAVALGVSQLNNNMTKKIVLARPAVEAGEKLGFLPGDMKAKVNPYLRPLYDALHDVMDFRQIRKYLENDLIEVIPLAFMRGRTLNDSFIILDEAQNCTTKQMLMCLTRMGQGSQIVVTGDVTQTDLPKGEKSGLVHAQEILGDTPGIAFVQLTKLDIVRHPLVHRIVDAYAR